MIKQGNERPPDTTSQHAGWFHEGGKKRATAVPSSWQATGPDCRRPRRPSSVFLMRCSRIAPGSPGQTSAVRVVVGEVLAHGRWLSPDQRRRKPQQWNLRQDSQQSVPGVTGARFLTATSYLNNESYLYILRIKPNYPLKRHQGLSPARVFVSPSGVASGPDPGLDRHLY